MIVQQLSHLPIKAVHPPGKKVQCLFSTGMVESTNGMRKVKLVAMRLSCAKGSTCSLKTVGAVTRHALIWLMALFRVFVADWSFLGYNWGTFASDIPSFVGGPCPRVFSNHRSK